MSTIFSPGKLLLTSEYVVLDGALALALPTKWGQEFFVEEIQDGNSTIYWTALHQVQPWLDAEIDYKNLAVKSTNLPEAAEFILKVIAEIKRLSVTFFNSDLSFKITTNLQFPPDFGLGSSSTLMNNLAEWSGVDAFELNENCLGGSGYDIAVAQEKSAIIYRNKPEKFIQKIKFNPSFKDELIFIHLNQKQDSREGISLYRSKEKLPAIIEDFSEITNRVLKAETLQEFSDLMILHEEKLGKFLGLQTVKEKHFPDAPVFLKSLGAWGGDFVLSQKFPAYEAYFGEKGFSRIFDFKDIIA